MIWSNYDLGVDWIDAYVLPRVTDRATMAQQLTVRLLAELFDKAPEDVACDVVALRRQRAHKN